MPFSAPAIFVGAFFCGVYDLSTILWQDDRTVRHSAGRIHIQKGKSMPRKKNTAQEAAPVETSATAAAVAEPEKAGAPPMARPDYIDGPPVNEEGNVIAQGPNDPNAKNWGPPYKAIFVSKDKGFEMGEDRRFKQRVFVFSQKPEQHVLNKLKDSGFVIRAAEKAWTIPANPATRVLSDQLAQEFAGKTPAATR